MEKSINLPDRGEITAFPHFDDKYKCCCQSVHVKQGAYIIGALSILEIGILIMSAVFSTDVVNNLITDISFGLIKLVLAISLFHGLKTNKKNFLLPYLVHEICLILLYIAGVAWFVWVFFSDSRYSDYIKKALLDNENINKDESLALPLRVLATMAITALVLSTIVTSWFVAVIYKCYIYLRDFENHRTSSEASISFEAANVLERV